MKFSTEANSHIDRRFHRGNCEGDGGSTSGVTILLYCDGGGGGESSFFAGASFFTGAGEEWRREAARMVHAREGRVLLVVGGGGAAAVSSFESETWFGGLGSGEDRWPGTEGGDPLAMATEIKLGFREVILRLHVEDQDSWVTIRL